MSVSGPVTASHLVICRITMSCEPSACFPIVGCIICQRLNCSHCSFCDSTSFYRQVSHPTPIRTPRCNPILIVLLLTTFVSNARPRQGNPDPGCRVFGVLSGNPVHTFCTPYQHSTHCLRPVAWHLTSGYRLFRVNPASA